MKNFNILVVDDDPVALDDLVLMYEDMVEWGDFSHKVQGQGSVSWAYDASEAERVIQRNLSEDSELVQILHVDQRMPGEQGSEFVDRMRRTYTDANMGAILVTAYATDVSVQNSREKGVYRYVPKPVTPDVVEAHLTDLLDMIQLKDKPQKQDIEGVYVFRELEGQQELEEAFQKRFQRWDKLGYIPDRWRSRNALEIDEFDRRAIHLGGFKLTENGEDLAVYCRVITPYEQPSNSLTAGDIIDKYRDETLRELFENDTEYSNTLARDCDQGGEFSGFISMYGGEKNAVEYSRIMSFERGKYLSTKMAQFHNMIAKHKVGAKVGVATCLVKHKHNITVNGFTDTIPHTGIFDAKRVEQIAQAIYVDLNNLEDEEPFYHASSVKNMAELYDKSGYVCYCRRLYCPPYGFIKMGTNECVFGSSRASK